MLSEVPVVLSANTIRLVCKLDFFYFLFQVTFILFSLERSWEGGQGSYRSRPKLNSLIYLTQYEINICSFILSNYHFKNYIYRALGAIRIYLLFDLLALG